MNLPPHLQNLQVKNINTITSNTSNTSSNVNVDNTSKRLKEKYEAKKSKHNLDKSEKRIRKLKKSKILKKKWKVVRKAGGEIWEDPTLEEWPENDFRIFCGDLGNEVSDDILANAFRKYSSFQKARVIRDKRTGKSRGYGFISFKDSNDYIKAMREMNGKYVGNRPIRLKRSTWKDRCLINSSSKVEIVKIKKNKNKIRKKMLQMNTANPDAFYGVQNYQQLPQQFYQNPMVNMGNFPNIPNVTNLDLQMMNNQANYINPNLPQQNANLPFNYSSQYYKNYNQ